MDELKNLIKTSLGKITKDKLCLVFEGSEVWKSLYPKPNTINIGDKGNIYINNRRLTFQLIYVSKTTLEINKKNTILYLIKIILDK